MKYLVPALIILLLGSVACTHPNAQQNAGARVSDEGVVFYGEVNNEPPQQAEGIVPSYLEQPNSPAYPPASFNVCQLLKQMESEHKVVTTATGLRYAVEKEGTGLLCDGADSTTVAIAYTMMCADGSSPDCRDHEVREQKVTFCLGLDTNLAVGFHEIVNGMREGETRLVAMSLDKAQPQGNHPFSRTHDYVYVRVTLLQTHSYVEK